MKEFTQEQIDRYIKKQTEECPYCNNVIIEINSGIHKDNRLVVTDIDMDGKQYWQTVFCPSCQREFREVYEIQTIEPLE